MAIIKCKMCGGDLNVTEGSTVAECEYCGTKQTVPTVDNEKKLTLFARANRLRLNNEFDKAAGVYESIIADFPEEAEAYWGLVLCTYGIEYVDDPLTAKKIPTCHRSSFGSVMDDPNLELATEYADLVARRVYREEAKQIEELRKGIIEVSSKEEPYDIFISYKELSEDGDRTLDSVIAQDIYTELTERGYRVFFSRITLEDKLGTEYEPYIFAALNSAKLMLVVGTDYEYFNAVWVKNEWSRFLSLIAHGAKKTLIPVFKGIDAYDMPKEFTKLSAQDMGKVGAMQDLMRGVEKILGGKKEEAPAPVQQAAAAPGVASLLKRAGIFLADEDWTKADEYYDRVLDIDPECGDAYYGKMLIEAKLTSLDMIVFTPQTGLSRATVDEIKKLIADRNKIAAIKAYRTATGAGLAEANGFIGAVMNGEMTLDVQGSHGSADAIKAAPSYKHFMRYGSPELKEKLEEKLREYALAEEEENRRKAEKARLKAEEAKRIAEEEARHKAEEARRKAEEERHRREADIEKRRQNVTDLVPLRERSDKYGKLICASDKHTIGLLTNGTVLSTKFIGDQKYNSGQCDTSEWSDIVAIATGDDHSVGLKSDGTVVTAGLNTGGQCNAFHWKNVVSIAAGNFRTVGIKSDGTVVSTVYTGDPSYYHGQCDTSEWSDIVEVALGSVHTVGLKSDGTVVATRYTGDQNWNEGQCDVSGWTDIVAIAAGSHHTVGLRSDGTVVATKYTKYDNTNHYSFDSGQRDVSSWKDIVAIIARDNCTIGLKSDGTIIHTRNWIMDDVSEWRDIVALSSGRFHVVGLKSDGTVVAVGDNDHGQCEVSDWTDVVAISAGWAHTVGLRSDGTVVTAGYNNYGQCEVSGWKLFKSTDTYDEEVAAEREAAERKAREEKIAALTEEKAKLTAELPNLQGMFKAGKRKEAESRIAAIDKELATLQA